MAHFSHKRPQIVPNQSAIRIPLCHTIMRRTEVMKYLINLAVILFWACICVTCMAGQHADAEKTPTVSSTKSDAKELSFVHNPWGKYLPESWIQKRTTTTIYEGGKVAQSTSYSTLKLETVEPDGLVLNESVTVELGMRSVGGEPQRKKYDPLLQPLAKDVRVVDLPNEQLNINGKMIDCKVRTYEQSSPQSNKTTKIWYHDTLAPYILYTETVRTSVPTLEQPKEKTLSYSRSYVLDLPVSTLRGRFFGTYRMKTIRRNTEGTSVSVSENSLRIPGGLHAELTCEYDLEQRLVRKTETQVLRYSIARPTASETTIVELVDSDYYF